MKTKKIILLLLISWITFSCEHDETLQQGRVQFSFSAASLADAGGRKQTDEIPDGANLILSISKKNSDSVFTFKKIELFKIGTGFTTAPLAFTPGDYTITDFMIARADGTVLFASPKAGSPLAAFVQKPLPLQFNVSNNTVANVDVEVIDATHKNPEQFGYASFGVNVTAGFPLSVFTTNDEGKSSLTSANAYILHDTDTLLTKRINPSVNNLFWTTHTGERYTLVVVKDGYAKYTKKFALDSLAHTLNGQPLALVLTPAFTITFSTLAPALNAPQIRLVAIALVGTPGASIHLDWGDGGSLQEISLSDNIAGSGGNINYIYHTYFSNPSKFFVSVTGELPAVKTLFVGDDQYVNDTYVDTLSIANLSGLEEFAGTFLHYGGHSIDFSHNPKLRSLSVFSTNSSLATITTLNISKNPLLFNVNLFYTPLSIASVNKLIDDLYSAVTAGGIMRGNLNLYTFRDGTVGLIGPPSPTQIEKLHALKNNYQWNVNPF